MAFQDLARGGKGRSIAVKPSLPSGAVPACQTPTILARIGRPPASTSEERRRQAMDAAEQVFLARGFHRTTMADIARSAGMSKKTIYLVFTSKEELLDAVLTRRFAAVTGPVDDADDGRPPASVLHRLLGQIARFALSAEEIAFLRLLIADAICGDTVAQALDRQGPFLGRTTLAQWLARQAAAGALTIGDPNEAAELLVGMVLGELHVRLLMNLTGPPDEAVIDARVTRAVALFLHAVSAIGPTP